MGRILEKKTLLGKDTRKYLADTLIMALGSEFFSKVSKDFEGLDLDCSYHDGNYVNELSTYVGYDDRGEVESIALSLDTYNPEEMELIAIRRGYNTLEYGQRKIIEPLMEFLPSSIKLKTKDEYMVVLDVCVDKSEPNRIEAAIISYINYKGFEYRVNNNELYFKKYASKEDIYNDIVKAGYECEYMENGLIPKESCLLKNNGMWYLMYRTLGFFENNTADCFKNTNIFSGPMLRKVLARNT